MVVLKLAGPGKSNALTPDSPLELSNEDIFVNLIKAELKKMTAG